MGIGTAQDVIVEHHKRRKHEAECVNGKERHEEGVPVDTTREGEIHHHH